MSEQPDEGAYNMSEQRLYQLHFYKELMSPDERSERYRLLVLSGATRDQASRWRDWSPPHYKQVFDFLLKPNIAVPSVSQQC